MELLTKLLIKLLTKLLMKFLMRLLRNVIMKFLTKLLMKFLMKFLMNVMMELLKKLLIKLLMRLKVITLLMQLLMQLLMKLLKSVVEKVVAEVVNAVVNISLRYITLTFVTLRESFIIAILFFCNMYLIFGIIILIPDMMAYNWCEMSQFFDTTYVNDLGCTVYTKAEYLFCMVIALLYFPGFIIGYFFAGTASLYLYY